MSQHIRLTVGVLLAIPFLTAERPAEEKSATELIRRMSEAYRAMRSSVMIRGEITRRMSRGERVMETKRGYRLIQGDTGIRADVCESRGGNSCVTYIRQSGEVVIHFSVNRSFAVLEKADPRAAGIQAALGAIQIALYGRLADLAATKYTVTSFKEKELKVNGRKRRCHHITLQPGEGEKKNWSGELWIDADSALVWRARLVKQDREAEWPLVEETVTWLETARDKEVPLEELRWKPRADAERLTRIPSGPLPH